MKRCAESSSSSSSSRSRSIKPRLESKDTPGAADPDLQANCLELSSAVTPSAEKHALAATPTAVPSSAPAPMPEEQAPPPDTPMKPLQTEGSVTPQGEQNSAGEAKPSPLNPVVEKREPVEKEVEKEEPVEKGEPVEKEIVDVDLSGQSPSRSRSMDLAHLDF